MFFADVVGGNESARVNVGEVYHIEKAGCECGGVCQWVFFVSQEQSHPWGRIENIVAGTVCLTE
jgi:hypothetical protein